MSAHADACLTEDAAIAYVHGRLTGDALAGAQAHLDRCTDCGRMIEQVGLARTVSGRHRDPGVAPPTNAPPPEAAFATTLPSSKRDNSLPRGTGIGRYVLLRRLGEGGMGVVYAAYDPELDRKVAIKLLRDDVHDPTHAEAHRSRLLREAQALARLSHPNVIVVHDVGTFGTQVFMAMEFVEGQTVGGWLREGKRSWREVVELFRLAGRGLAAAHAAGLVHRDFKPENVILGKDGRVRVMDFGLARSTDPNEPSISGVRAMLTSTTDLRRSDALGEPLTDAGTFLGTPGYMAPEQHHGGEVDARTDQFSFCVALYEALYGERPFAGQTTAALGLAVGQGMVKEPPRDSSVPGWIRKLLLRGLAVRPSDRFPSMEALLLALSPPSRRLSRRKVALIVASAVAALSVAYVFSQSARVKMCQDREGDELSMFDATARTKLAAAFMATGARNWEADFARAAKQLERHLGELGVQRDSACEALRSSTATSARLASRMRCIDRQAELVRALLSQLGSADAVAVERATDAVYGLPSPATCSAREAWRSAPGWPDDRVRSDRATNLSQKLAKARALQLLGRAEDALSVARAVHAEAEAGGYEPIKAEALLRVGALQSQLELRESAQSTLYEAIWSGEAARHDQVVAEAWVQLVDVVGVKRGFEEQGLQCVRHAEAAIRRLGGAPDLEVHLAEVHARLQEKRGLHAQALASREVALERAAAADAEHPRTGDAMDAVAKSLEHLHRYAEAAQKRQQAVELLSRLRGESHSSLRDSLFAFGRDLLSSEQPARAVAPLERALALGERTLPAAELAELRFALARALWGATMDRDRARRLAELARDGAPREPGSEATVVRIETWLAAHDAP